MATRFLAPLPSPSNWFPEPLFQLQREIDRVFEDAFGGARSSSGRGSALMSMPRIDVLEADGEIRIHADLPGVSPDDLDVRVDGDMLTIRGERKSESQRTDQNFHVMERSQGRFQRSVQLPFAPEPQQVQAEVREGVLEVRVPKRAAQERSRRIEVRNAGQGAQQLSESGSSSSAAGSTGGTDGSDLASDGSNGAGDSATSSDAGSGGLKAAPSGGPSSIQGESVVSPISSASAG